MYTSIKFIQSSSKIIYNFQEGQEEQFFYVPKSLYFPIFTAWGADKLNRLRD